MMENCHSFMDRVSAQAALYLVCSSCITYWFFQLLGFGFIFGVVFGIVTTVIFELYMAYKLFNYKDYLLTSKQIEDNRAYWKKRLAGYEDLKSKDISELGPYNKKDKDLVNDNKQAMNSSFSYSEEDSNENDGTQTDKQKIKQKMIEKSLHDLNDANSNIMLSTGYTPLSLSKQESLRMLNMGTHKNEDKNFEVQFRSRLMKAESYTRYFIKFYGSVTAVENQMTFKTIIDQKMKYSLTKRNFFNIFKKGSKWVQIRYLLKRLEGIHQDNAVFIENAVKGQFEAFLQSNSDRFNTFRTEYEDLKKLKYEKLTNIEILKTKHKEQKQNLEEVLLKYEKAKEKGNMKYDKLLELEMKAKLAQKLVQDEAANILDAKEHIKELRDEMKIK